jgi:hypothetical protein
MATGLKSGKTYAGEENRATSRASPAHGWMCGSGVMQIYLLGTQILAAPIPRVTVNG